MNKSSSPRASAHNVARLANRIVHFLSGYAFAVIILSFMLVLTFLGTLEQVDHGLYAVQKKYFDSLFLVHDLFGKLPLLLPGVYLLMVLLFINLILGGIVRAPKSWRYPGMMVAHSGILILLVGGFVAHHFSISGGMQLYEGRAGSTFQSYHDWVIELKHHQSDGTTRIYEIPTHALTSIRPGAEREFFGSDIPFTLTVSGYAQHCQPRPVTGASPFSSVDGFYLQTLPREAEAEMNVAGAYVVLDDKQGGILHEAIVWGLERAPSAVTVNDQIWSVGMARKSWSLPFTIHLDKFTVEMHPNTGMAKVFLSDVTKIEGRSQEKLKITMNEPFRYKGYTLFQSSWGPDNAPPGTPLFSGFSVVKNPTDHWPLYSCIVVGIGMLIHFFQRLAMHLRVRARS